MTMLAGVWSRRSLAVVMATFVAGAFAFGAWSRDGWQYEWLWGMRSPLVVANLVAPALAAAVAYDVARFWTPLQASLGPTARRMPVATLVLPATYVLWAFVAISLVWGSIAVRLAGEPAIWQPDPWLPIEVLGGFSACAAFGLYLGTTMRPVAAAPIAAVAVFALEALAVPYGISGIFAAIGLIDSTVGLERDPEAAGLATALSVTVAASLCYLALRRGNPWRWRRPQLVSVVALALVLLLEFSTSPLDYRPVSGPTFCTSGQNVMVCGNTRAKPLISDLSVGLGQAARSLSRSGLELPSSYTLGRAGVTPQPGQRGVAFVSPAELRGGQRADTLARVLSQPRICAQFIEPTADTTALLDRQDRVRRWVEQALKGTDAPAPGGVRNAYRDITSCTIAR